VEGGGTAKTPANHWQGVPRYLWEGKTMEGTTPPPLKALGVSDTRGRYGAAVAGLSSGVGRTVWVLEAPRGRYGSVR